MSKNNLSKNEVKNKKSSTPSYKSPTETVWGKIVIWTLIIGTVGLIFVSLIMAIIQGI